MAPTTKWTSKADNSRTFRGQPSIIGENALRRQFKKPRRSVEEVQVETAQDVIEVQDTDVQLHTAEVETEDVVIEVAEDSVIEIAEDSDGSEDNIPFSELKEKMVAERVGLHSDEEDTQLPDTNERMTPKLGLLGIGTEVMKQFDAGLFVGTVISYDRKDKLYKISYSDGDKEDMDEDEYMYAYQLALANGGDSNDLSSRDSADEESAYQLPKKQVN